MGAGSWRENILGNPRKGKKKTFPSRGSFTNQHCGTEWMCMPWIRRFKCWVFHLKFWPRNRSEPICSTVFIYYLLPIKYTLYNFKSQWPKIRNVSDCQRSCSLGLVEPSSEPGLPECSFSACYSCPWCVLLRLLWIPAKGWRSWGEMLLGINFTRLSSVRTGLILWLPQTG